MTLLPHWWLITLGDDILMTLMALGEDTLITLMTVLKVFHWWPLKLKNSMYWQEGWAYDKKDNHDPSWWHGKCHVTVTIHGKTVMTHGTTKIQSQWPWQEVVTASDDHCDKLAMIVETTWLHLMTYDNFSSLLSLSKLIINCLSGRNDWNISFLCQNTQGGAKQLSYSLEFKRFKMWKDHFCIVWSPLSIFAQQGENLFCILIPQ